MSSNVRWHDSSGLARSLRFLVRQRCSFQSSGVSLGTDDLKSLEMREVRHWYSFVVRLSENRLVRWKSMMKMNIKIE